MRFFAYNELTGDIDSPSYPGHETVVVSDDDILNRYWNHWSGQMLQHGGLSPRITEANCLDDFVVVNWAWEVPPPLA